MSGTFVVNPCLRSHHHGRLVGSQPLGRRPTASLRRCPISCACGSAAKEKYQQGNRVKVARIQARRVTKKWKSMQKTQDSLMGVFLLGSAIVGLLTGKLIS